MVLIPAEFDGRVSMKVVDQNRDEKVTAIATTSTVFGDVALRLSRKACFIDARLQPSEALILGQALTRCAYRALDRKERQS